MAPGIAAQADGPDLSPNRANSPEFQALLDEVTPLPISDYYHIWTYVL